MFKKIFIFGLACLFLQQTFAAKSTAQQQDCLNAHNEYRKAHGVPPLRLDRQLTEYAQEWADELARYGKFEHRPNGKYGENIFAVFGNPNISGREPVKSWYDEIKDYDFGKPGFGRKTGHFTQVVWRDSQKLGCAFAKTGNNVYVVANYDPRGNFLGRFSENVPAPV